VQLREKARDTLKAKEKDGYASILARIDRLERENKILSETNQKLSQQAMDSVNKSHPAMPNPHTTIAPEVSADPEQVSLVSDRTLKTLTLADKKKSAQK
jgi:hypothetical protein